MKEGTVLVALIGRSHAIKLYPPFLRDHFEFERAALTQIGGRLQVPTPTLQRTGEYQGWPPRVVRGPAAHATIASSVNHTVKLPRWLAWCMDRAVVLKGRVT